MRDPYQNREQTNLKTKLLALDAKLDSGMYQLVGMLGSFVESAHGISRKFRVTGWKYWTVQLLSGGVTMGVAGSILALMLAMSSFERTENGLTPQDDFAITFLDRYGNEIGHRGILQDDSFALDDLPDHVIKAVLSTEDRRFFEHFGIDFFGLARAIVENARAGGVVQGGSTLTQQLAKNLFLTNERTLTRKIDEAFLSLWLEANLTKRQILKLYLDRAYMGGGTFGIAAASEYYFGKSAKNLTLAEAAMLAGLFKAPTKYAPHVNLPAARARAKEVLVNMVQAGFMTEGQIVNAMRYPATPVDKSDIYVPNYFLDWAFEEVKRISKTEDRVLTVKTSIDVTLQKQAERAVEDNLRKFGKQYRVNEAAAVLMEPSGAVVAVVGGRDYGKSQFNRATDAKRQPGSSFKPFVYTAAMMNGYRPNSVMQDAPISIGNWSPKNYNRSYSGAVTLTYALKRSINTIPVRLAQAIGRKKIVDTAYKMGVESELLITRSLPLGAAEVTVMDMATGYAVFASGGKQAKAHGVLEIVNSKGKVIYDRARDVTQGQAIPPQAIAKMNKMMVTVVESGTGRRAALNGIRAAGKTGTTSAYKDAWFVGYTGNYSAAVWFGNDNNRATNRLTGGNLPAMTWQSIMSAAHQQVELKPLPFVDPFPGSRKKSKTQLAQGRIKDLKEKRKVQRLSPVTVKELDKLADMFGQKRSLKEQSEQPSSLQSKNVEGLSEIKKPVRKGLSSIKNITSG